MSSRPNFRLVRENNNSPNTINQMRGGNFGTYDNVPVTPAQDSAPMSQEDQFYLRKAQKYHYKIQKKLMDMRARGEQIPSGYERYMSPFAY